MVSSTDLYIRPALHPGWRRCSSLTDAQYARSSRLASRAHRQPRCTALLELTTLDPLAVSQRAASVIVVALGQLDAYPGRIGEERDLELDALHLTKGSVEQMRTSYGSALAVCSPWGILVKINVAWAGTLVIVAASALVLSAAAQPPDAAGPFTEEQAAAGGPAIGPEPLAATATEAMQISVDGGPFINLGTVRWERVDE